MLSRDLKKVASDCCFNPKNPTKGQDILMDVGNPLYWVTRAMEYLRNAQNLAEGSNAFNSCVQQATTLLIVTRAHIDAKKNDKSAKTRKRAAGKDNSPPAAT